MMSSPGPHQKMVLLGPPQPNEVEQRKKRQTLERAKANHLSRQLQMRLQYAKLKVEHGWQRQNLNEVENLYFHHSHQRSIRQNAAQRPHHATVTSAPAQTQSPAPLDGPSPSANDASSPGPVSPLSEHALNADGPPLSQFVHAPIPPQPSSALDLTDPNILARLAQLQAQSQTQTLSPPPSASTSQPTPVPVPVPNSGAFPQSGPFTLTFAQQPLSTPIPASVPNSVTFSVPTPTPAPQPSSVPVPAAPAPATATSTPIPIPTPTSTPIAPTALTYDSFWSTHASSTGPTRALYRTHTGFTASATPGGNVAMLTPGGHAAVMTAEGVYVGGGTK